MHSIRDFLLYWDYTIWYQLNVIWQNPVLDAVMPYFRNQWFWTPVYLFLLVFVVKNFGKKGWLWCVGYLVTFAIADFTSASLLKPYFMRMRPCNDPNFAGIVHLLVPCGSGQSFPSTHATNHFAMSFFIAVTLGKKYKIAWPLALLWATLVIYAQVYVGVHFPLDVTVGGALGACIGLFMGKLFTARYKLRN